MRCSAEVCTISGGSAGCFFQLRKEIQPFILFDGHFLLHVRCSHSISWRRRIFKSIDKHSKWFSMQEMGFSSYIYCPTACGGKVVPQAPKGDGPFGARGQWWRLTPQVLAAVWRSVLHSVISTCSVVHPLATSWPSSPKGDASFLPFTVVPLDEIKRNAQKKEAPWEELLFISGEIRMHNSGIRSRNYRRTYLLCS